MLVVKRDADPHRSPTGRALLNHQELLAELRRRCPHCEVATFRRDAFSIICMRAYVSVLVYTYACIA